MDNRTHYRTYRDLVEYVMTSLDRQGFPSDDIRLSKKLIYHSLLDMRTSYIKRSKISRQGIGRENVQTIPCMKMEEADTNICPCRPPTGCLWLKTKEPIPKSIYLTSVTNSNAAFKADYVEWSQFKNKINSRANKSNTRYYTILDTGEGPYIYLYNDIFLENISLSGLWEDPNHAAYFTSCGEETKMQKELRCNPLDTPIYMDGNMTDVILKMTIDLLARNGQISSIDINSDSLDNAPGNVENNTV